MILNDTQKNIIIIIYRVYLKQQKLNNPEQDFTYLCVYVHI